MIRWELGAVAYNRYLDYWVTLNGLPRGLPWPDWDDLSVDEKEAWSAAAEAVKDTP